MNEYYVLRFKCNNCYHTIDFKFEIGVEAPKYNAGICHYCGINKNVVTPVRVKFIDSELVHIPMGSKLCRRVCTLHEVP